MGVRTVAKLNLTGHRFGKLTVLCRMGIDKQKKVLWACKCDCGEVRTIRAKNLRAGDTTSCGCAQRAAVTTHGMSTTRTWRSWSSMRLRCLNPNAPDYDRYGGRGIVICKAWLRSFERFYADMGERPKGQNLDRIDPDDNYKPSNCRWATPKEQACNRRNTAKLTYQGQTRTLIDWSEITGIPPRILNFRLGNGWSPERAFSTPVRAKRDGRKARKD